MPELLRGKLGSLGLGSVLQLLQGEALTGELELPQGGLTFQGGLVTGARFRDQRGAAAALEHFLTEEGEFAFQQGEVPPGEELLDGLTLVLEGARLADEFKRAAPQAVRWIRPPESPVLAALQPELPPHRSLAEGVAKAGQLRVRVVDPLLAALESGALALVPPAAPPPPPPDFYEQMETGRRALRERRLVEAERAFAAALVARPDDRVALQNLARVRQLRSEGGGR